MYVLTNKYPKNVTLLSELSYIPLKDQKSENAVKPFKQIRISKGSSSRKNRNLHLLINKTLIVYYYKCALCDTDYVGITSRHLHQRVKEHKRSSIGNHVKGEHEEDTKAIERNLMILKKSQSRLDCLIFVNVMLCFVLSWSGFALLKLGVSEKCFSLSELCSFTKFVLVIKKVYVKSVWRIFHLFILGSPSILSYYCQLYSYIIKLFSVGKPTKTTIFSPSNRSGRMRTPHRLMGK